MDINVSELKRRMEGGEKEFVLIDVREGHEREEFNIGGIHVPLGNMMQAIPSLSAHEEQEVIVYCRSGKRSAMAQHLLRQAGFKNVRNLEGGMLAWTES